MLVLLFPLDSSRSFAIGWPSRRAYDQCYRVSKYFRHDLTSEKALQMKTQNARQKFSTLFVAL